MEFEPELYLRFSISISFYIIGSSYFFLISIDLRLVCCSFFFFFFFLEIPFNIDIPQILKYRI
jgi:hypothetical protein